MFTNFSGGTLDSVGLITRLSFPTLLPLRKANLLDPISTPTSTCTEGIPERERLPCGCDRPSGSCAGWPGGFWTAAEHWQVKVTTAAKWPVPELHSYFFPDVEDSRIIITLQVHAECTVYTLPAPFLPSRPRTRLCSMAYKEQNKEFQKL